MVSLRPLIVVTGAVHVEGGHKQKRIRSGTDSKGNATATSGHRTVLQQHRVSSDRLEANTIATGFMRKLRGLRLLKTPLGTLVDPKRLPEVKAMILDASTRAGEFNKSDRGCLVVNCMVWEHLSGNRLAAVCAWIDLLSSGDDADVKKALPQLVS